MGHGYPVFLEVRGRLCLVVGGGAVAERKARALLAQGAAVRVVSPTLTGALAAEAAAGRIAHLERPFTPTDLEGAFLAFAATDDAAVNAAVAAAADAAHVPVNVADDPARSTFLVPSTLQRGEVIVAVSTGGASPALARRLRTDLEEKVGEEYAALARLLGEARREVLRRIPDPRRRQDLFTRLPEDLHRALRDGGEGAARRLLTTLLREAAGTPRE
ncbi:MAG: bifunctional precorrin-2 dehydrogenase/sirohydrochlorin ferrochelatase [candidate division NC10 bacterium]|nr:bifunctional precorrin-2 dehydrogenase/sirohydrochlorin ferrochelatase [candidate division NC10 bacterium]MBI3002059.1 bifunctional precorrin-2 dehydrogenase/sirohydrochlorin ferrochelatase [candidate division NC10 bacterium]